MSWFSRAGRFSPFGRSSNNADSTEVTDDNYSYITKEDLANNNMSSHHRASPRAAAPEIVDWDDKDPNRATDVLVFKNARTNYPTHFPAQSIRDGDLTVGTMRQAAAKKMGISDSSRIRMFYKGRNLKHDEHMAREEGLRGDGSGSEVLCVIGEAGTGTMAPGSEDAGPQRAYSDNSDDDDDTEIGGDDSHAPGAKKKGRKRGGKSKKRKQGSSTGSPTPGMGYSNSTATNPEYLGHVPGPKPSATPSPNISRVATPQTPLEKLGALNTKFRTEYVPLCEEYLKNPPAEQKKRVFEGKKLSEAILGQIILKLDGIEADGNQAVRDERKKSIVEVNAMLARLDDLQKP